MTRTADQARTILTDATVLATSRPSPTMGRSEVAAEESFDPELLVATMAPLSLRAVARRIGVDPAMLCRPLSAGQADRYATRLGLHPSEVWGADWSRPERRR